LPRSKSRTLPSSWGTSVIRLPCSNPTPAGLLASDHCDTAAWPLVCKKQRLPRKVFRSSIAWLSDSLFTLRGVSYLSTTQNSLPVAGQALLDGVRTRKVPMKRFQSCRLHLIPPSQAFLAQSHRPLILGVSHIGPVCDTRKHPSRTPCGTAEQQTDTIRLAATGCLRVRPHLCVLLVIGRNAL
jgi:hypothetical protein